jgi:hypothetical protein
MAVPAISSGLRASPAIQSLRSSPATPAGIVPRMMAVAMGLGAYSTCKVRGLPVKNPRIRSITSRRK